MQMSRKMRLFRPCDTSDIYRLPFLSLIRRPNGRVRMLSPVEYFRLEVLARYFQLKVLFGTFESVLIQKFSVRFSAENDFLFEKKIRFDRIRRTLLSDQLVEIRSSDEFERIRTKKKDKKKRIKKELKKRIKKKE